MPFPNMHAYAYLNRVGLLRCFLLGQKLCLKPCLVISALLKNVKKENAKVHRRGKHAAETCKSIME